MTTFAKKQELLSESQYGFVHRGGTQALLAKLSDTFHNSIDQS